ncbi:Uncharacterized protein YvbT [Geodia barretti]|uniref:Uncharacterized protein YvbT n=1 Tax=Geodia barretti TaxID=519541 RepID=A0AA35TVL6_GEOBA|nr:Uncharacterized protein YvbT [Geodia barretti]
MVALSILDLSPIPEGADAAQAFGNTVELARHVERLGFRRYWLAEHHNMAGIGSAATAVLIGHVAGATATIRVGAGGIMLPNHAPLVIAEQFGTLESLYPGRIDLGIGRAPGTDQMTSHALRRTLTGDVNDFPPRRGGAAKLFPADTAGQARARGAGRRPQRADLDSWFQPLRRAARGRARAPLRLRLALCARGADAGDPGLSRAVPPLGTVRRALRDGGLQRLRRRQRGGGRLCAELGPAIGAEPASERPRPPAPPGARVRGHPGCAGALHSRTLVHLFGLGHAETVAERLGAFAEQTGVDEIMVTSNIHDHAARLRSYEITAEVGAALAGGSAAQEAGQAG